jgi:hypothetical protein
LGDVSLADFCLTPLHSHNQQHDRARVAAAQDVAVSTGRQLRQDVNAYDTAAAAPANTTTDPTTPAADAVTAGNTTATEEQLQTAASSSNTTTVTDSSMNDMNAMNSTSSSNMNGMNSTAAPEVLAQDQLLADAANITAANSTANSSAPSNMTVVCALQPETGPCRASLPRWAFDVAAASCKEFVYGGCRGNANNFVSQQACEAACSAVMGAAAAPEPPPAVEVPPSTVFVTVDDPRVLAGSAPAAASSSGAGRGRSWAEQLVRVVLAGVVGVVMLLLL